jgi:uncharacterized RDD family membrane protein YckC
MNKYKTFAPRFFALILDTVLLLPLAIAADALAETAVSEGQRNIFLAILNLANVIYFVILHGLYGQTAGKYLAGVKVVREDESPVGFKAAILRNIPQIILVLISLIPAMNVELGGTAEAPLTPISISIALWGLADVMVFILNSKGRALHDLIAGTVVIRLEQDKSTHN